MLVGLQPSNEAVAAGSVDASSAARPAPRRVAGAAALLTRAKMDRAGVSCASTNAP